MWKYDMWNLYKTLLNQVHSNFVIQYYLNILSLEATWGIICDFCNLQGFRGHNSHKWQRPIVYWRITQVKLHCSAEVATNLSNWWYENLDGIGVNRGKNVWQTYTTCVNMDYSRGKDLIYLQLSFQICGIANTSKSFAQVGRVFARLGTMYMYHLL